MVPKQFVQMFSKDDPLHAGNPEDDCFGDDVTDGFAAMIVGVGGDDFPDDAV